jgi:serine/threonine-protein phosphatase 6 regulatory ankyrin repeat subunit B
MSKWGTEPLHVAATFGKTEVARLLLDHKADVNAKLKDGQRPLHFAAREGHLDVVKLLLDNGADLNAENADGFSPLHKAAKSGQAGVVRLLLDRRAAIDGGAPKFFPQPLHLAAGNGHWLVVELVSVHELKGVLGYCSALVDEGGTTRKRPRGNSAPRFRLSSGQPYGK